MLGLCKMFSGYNELLGKITFNVSHQSKTHFISQYPFHGYNELLGKITLFKTI
jgi:hypothetical protein